jgi:hypothetical protein
MTLVTAVEMAKEADISSKSFRAALRKEGFSWHDHPYKRWAVAFNSPEHEDMRRVLVKLTVYGAMLGTITVAPGVDLSEGAGEIWNAEQ